MSKAGYWFIRVLFLNGLLLGEKGKCGAGIFARKNKSGIAEFVYNYDGTIGGNNYSYGVSDKNGAVTFTYKAIRRRDLGETEITVDNSVLDRLNQLYYKYRIAAWNGYSKYNSRIRDGKAFSLYIKFKNGKSLHAGGTNAFPARYGEFTEEMKSVLDPLRDKILGVATEETE
ncbi:MAG: hypothetical protein J5662_07515 [Clostridia bacterium]|nr:hypothetical protein [Clostridia bacterium]